MYVTLNRGNGKIWLEYYDGHCGYDIEDNEENQVLLSFPAHMRYKNKVNLDDDFMRSLWRVLGITPGRIRLVTNALIDIRDRGKVSANFLEILERKLRTGRVVEFSLKSDNKFAIKISLFGEDEFSTEGVKITDFFEEGPGL